MSIVGERLEANSNGGIGDDDDNDDEKEEENCTIRNFMDRKSLLLHLAIN